MLQFTVYDSFGPPCMHTSTAQIPAQHHCNATEIWDCGWAFICDTHPSTLLLLRPPPPPHLKSGLFLISSVPPLNPGQSRYKSEGERGRLTV